MEDLGTAPGNLAIAEYYRDFLDGLVIDRADEHEVETIEKLGIKVKNHRYRHAIHCRTGRSWPKTTLEFAFRINPADDAD